MRKSFILTMCFALFWNYAGSSRASDSAPANTVSGPIAVSGETLANPTSGLITQPIDWIGEEMEYGVYFGFIPAGRALLTVLDTVSRNGQLTVRAVSSARSAKAYDVIFKVRDSIETWMDADSVYSHRFRKQLREGGYRDEKIVEFDHLGGKIQWWDDGAQKPTMPVPPRSHDVLAAGFKARTLPLAVGDTFYIKTHDVNKTYDLMVMVLGMEEIECCLGKVECFKCEPVFRSGGLFKKERGARVYVWVTADNRRIPVRVSSRVSFGTFAAVLDRYVPPTGHDSTATSP